MNPPYGRRNVNASNNPPYADPRMQSNPQPIPQNPSLAPLPRGGTPTTRSYPGQAFSPAQSPQHHAQYIAPQNVYGGSGMNTSEENVSHTPIIQPSNKSQANTPFMWGPRPPFNTQAHHTQAASVYSNTNYSKQPVQNSGTPYPSYQHNSVNIMYMTNTVRQTRYVTPNQQPIHASIPTASVGYYQQTPGYFPNPMQPVGPYTASHYDPTIGQQTYPAPSAQVIHAPNMVQQQPQMQISSRKKVITIKDPTTMQDITNDVLQSGRSDSTSPSNQTNQAPATDEQSRIAANFAAQVARAIKKPAEADEDVATDGASPMLPKHLDTSVPPPSLTILSSENSMPSPVPLSMDADTTQVASSNAVESTSAEEQLPVSVSSLATSDTAALTPVNSDAQSTVVLPASMQSKTQDDTNTVSMPSEPQEEQPDSAADVNSQLTSSVQNALVATEEIEQNSDSVEHSESTTSDAVMSEASRRSKNSLDLPPLLAQTVPDKLTENGITDETLNDIADAPDSQPNLDTQEDALTTSVEVDKDVSEDVARSSADQSAPAMETDSNADSPPAVAPESIVKEDNPSPGEILPVLLPSVDAAVQLDKKNMDQVPTIDIEVKKKDVESGDKAMSGDAAAPENGDKLPAKEPQPETTAAPEDERTSLQNGVPPSESVISNDDAVNKSTEVKKEEKAEEQQNGTDETLDPSNPQKKVYNRDFLMKYRFHDTSMLKPKDLPAIDDIVMDRPLPKSSVSNSLPSIDMANMGGYRDRSDFTPQWMGGGGYRPGRQTSRGSRGGSQQRQQPAKVIKKVSIPQETELNKAENAWKPSKLDSSQVSAATTTEEAQTEEILKQVRSILNKLTPQKFSPLMQKFQQLQINSEVRLREVINLIFEKAIDEPNFCEAYANMCRTMSQFRVTTPAPGAQGSAPSGSVEFRKILLTRCQREFERDRTNENTLADLRKKVEDAKTETEKQQFQEELKNSETKQRRRMLGNIRFIGELFKLQMLTESIMHNCVMSLFRGRDEEGLECLCRLLTTIGKGLDHPKGKQRMDQYFNQIDKIIRERKTSARVRFMLTDVVDLRKNSWLQRAIKAQGPKTIDQIHADAKEEKEQLALQVAAAASSAPPMKSQSRGNRMGSRGSGGHNADDGWTKVGMQQKPTRYDPQKMKLSKFDESNVTLGPNRGGKPVWKSGSGSITTKTGSGGYSYRDNMDSGAPRSSTPTMMNRFSALGTAQGYDPYSQRGPGRVSSQERNRSDSRGSGGATGSRGRDERQSAVETVRRLTSFERKQPEVMDVAAANKSPIPAVSSAKDSVDEAALTKKIESTIKEFLQIVDIKEATECFDELKIPPSCGHLIVKSCLELSLEKSSNDRNNVSQLLSSLVGKGKIIPEQYLKGVISNMELAVDIELDLPKVWACLAEQVTPIFYGSSGKISLSTLKNMAKPLFEFEKAAVFVAEILKKLMNQVNADTAVQYWKDSNLDITYFLQSVNPSDIKDFLERYELEGFYTDSTSTTNGKTQDEINFDGYFATITKQLDMNKPNNEICSWAETNIGTKERAKPNFVRAMTAAVCNKAIKQGDKNLEVDKDLIKNRTSLLNKYIDDEAKELQAVYALQKLFIDLEQPANLLKLLFDALYDEDVITEQTFFKWEETEDPNECEGRGVALLSVNPFFTWLRQADVDSDEN